MNNRIYPKSMIEKAIFEYKEKERKKKLKKERKKKLEKFRNKPQYG